MDVNDHDFEQYQKPVAFGSIIICSTEMHSQVLTLLAG